MVGGSLALSMAVHSRALVGGGSGGDILGILGCFVKLLEKRFYPDIPVGWKIVGKTRVSWQVKHKLDF